MSLTRCNKNNVDLGSICPKCVGELESSLADEVKRQEAEKNLSDSVPRSRYDVACDQYNEAESNRAEQECHELRFLVWQLKDEVKIMAEALNAIAKDNPCGQHHDAMAQAALKDAYELPGLHKCGMCQAGSTVNHCLGRIPSCDCGCGSAGFGEGGV